MATSKIMPIIQYIKLWVRMQDMQLKTGVKAMIQLPMQCTPRKLWVVDCKGHKQEC